MNKQFKHSATPATIAAINNLERSELVALAKTAGVPVGKSKSNTVSSVVKAVAAGKLQVKSVLTVTLPAAAGSYARHGAKVFEKKFRSYRPDKVLFPLS
jgi:ABC-type taurine transport system substrate-binding protein